MLNVQHLAGADGVLVGLADAEAGADLGAFLRERRIVGFVDGADEIALLVKDAQGFSGQLINGDE